MKALQSIIGAKCKSNSPNQADFIWCNNSLDLQYKIRTQMFLVIISGLVNSGYLFSSLYVPHFNNIMLNLEEICPWSTT